MANAAVTQPSHEQLREAFQAGFDSIDDGEGFYFGFRAFLGESLTGHNYAFRN